jgi:DNA-binding beta-propeller fold protein YncE
MWPFLPLPEVVMFKPLGCCLLVGMLAAVQQADPLVLVKTIALPGVNGRIDHLAVDLQNGRLFVAALGNNTLEVVDLQSGTHARTVKGLHEPQGIALPPDGTIVAVANGAGGDLQLFDRNGFATVTSTTLGDDPDNVRYDAWAKRLYVGYGSGAIAAVDAQTGRRLVDVKLAGHPESFQLEANGPRIYVNVPSARQIAIVDREAMKLLMTWPVTETSANYPMALDEARHRLFIGCRRPAKVLVYDTSTGSRVASIDAVGDTDDLFYDAKRQRLYVTGGDGAIDVFDVGAPTGLTRIAHIASAPGARTSLFVPELSRLYVAVPHRGSQPAEILVYEAR